MKDLLLLVHRIPFPPNKGDKIRSFHLLKHLSQSYRVHLGCFIDDQQDWQYVSEVEKFCASLECVELNPRLAKLRSLRGFVTGQALTVPYYQSDKMTAWVKRQMSTHSIERCVVFSSSMIQYVPPGLRNQHCVIDFVDIDSDKWRQYAATTAWPMNWIYQREARKLAQYENQAASWARASVFVSHQEAALFKQLNPELADKQIVGISNGVDFDFFDPDAIADQASPYGDKTVIAFTGAMDYWANADAAIWFAREVWPVVLQHKPDAWFYIVGARPLESVKALQQEYNHIVVTGMVDDIRPYIAHASLAVAPLRIARGIQNKVLEAMAMATVIITSQQAMEGIQADAELQQLVFDRPEDMAQGIINLLDDPQACQQLARQGRQFVQRLYDWNENLKQFNALLEAHD